MAARKTKSHPQRSLSVDPVTRAAVRKEAEKFGVKQHRFVAILMRAWESLPMDKRLKMIPAPLPKEDD